jgi:hypothetical protein
MPQSGLGRKQAVHLPRTYARGACITRPCGVANVRGKEVKSAWPRLRASELYTVIASAAACGLQTGGGGALSNNRLERTVNPGWRPVLAMDCVLARAQRRSWPADQLGR